MSIATVSHALNGTRPVSAPTRERVLKAVERTGYTPNNVARALRRSSTDSLGIVISDFANPYYTEVVRGIEEEAGAAGLHILLANSGDNADRELNLVESLVQRRVDGIILAPTAGSTSRALSYLTAQQMPVVLIDRLTQSGFDQVGVNNEEPTRRLVHHLVRLGHRRIAIVAGVRGISTTEERLGGYRRALARYDIPFDENLVRAGDSRVGPAADAVHELMASAHPPTSIVAANNLMAIGVLRALQARGLRVPQDVAVVAFDDFEWSELLDAPLTTVAQPCYQIGQEAVRLLMRRLRNRDVKRKTVRLEPSLVHRRSCGCGPDSTEQL